MAENLDLFEDYDSSFEFEGFTAEELGEDNPRLEESLNSDIEVEEYQESEEEDDTDSDYDAENVNPDKEAERWIQHNFVDHHVKQFEGIPGPTKVLDQSKTAQDFFHLMWPKALYQYIADETNKYVKFKRHPPLLPDTNWDDVTADEIKVYLGLRVYMSIVNLPTTKMYWLQNPLFGSFTASDVMTRNRFDKITEYIHVNDRSTMPAKDSQNFDKLYLIRPLLSRVNNLCLKNYSPHREFSIDEAMIKFRGRLGFRQYMPAKPRKYGIKVWVRADSHNGYVNEFDVYVGRPQGNRPEVGLGRKVIERLSSRLEGKGHHSYCDNYFSSVAGFQERFSKQVYMCGTVKSNCKGFPAELKAKKVCEKLVRQSRCKMELWLPLLGVKTREEILYECYQPCFLQIYQSNL